MIRAAGLVLVTAIFGTMADCDILVYSQEPPTFFQEEFQDMPARFGPELPTEGMRTFAVMGEPRDGCGPMQGPPSPTIPNFTGNWVVIVARYNCSFEAKVRNAQAANFDGVIVHNVNSNALEYMSADNTQGINIPSVFVGQRAARLIEENYPYEKGYFLVINGNFPFNNLHLLVPLAIVIAISFIIMVMFLVVRCVREHRRARRHRLPNSSLKKIPICKFAKGDPYDMCAICLDDYVEGDKLRVLPCAHAYHCKCIDPWLTKNRRVCPVCKRKVFAQGERRHRRRAELTNSQNSRDSDSDSDTGDDRAPLVNSSSRDQTTQGGTFQRQSENPFVGAYRSASRARSNDTSNDPRPDGQQTRPSEQRGGPFLTGILNLRSNLIGEVHQYDEESLNDDRQSLLAAGPSIASRSPSTGKERSKKTRKASGDSSSNRSRKSSKTSRRHQRRGSDSTQVSSNSERCQQEESNQPQPQTAEFYIGAEDVERQSDPAEVGRIGVAALPNVHIAEDERGDGRGNDFIV